MWWFIAFKAGVPNLQELMPDNLRWSWCTNNNRDRVHSECNVVWIALKLTSLPQSMKNCLPWNHFLVPQRLGTAVLRHRSWTQCVLSALGRTSLPATQPECWLTGTLGSEPPLCSVLWSRGFQCPEAPHREVAVGLKWGSWFRQNGGCSLNSNLPSQTLAPRHLENSLIVSRYMLC